MQVQIRHRTFALLTVGLILLAAASPIFAIEPFRYRLVGEIDGRWPVQMDLIVEGSKVSGQYWYDSYGTALQLDGVNRGGAFGVRELTADGEVTGEWVFDFNPFANEWNGTWTSADGTREYPFSLRLVAEMVQTQEMRRGFLYVWLERPVFHYEGENKSMAAVQGIVDEALWSSVEEDFELFPEIYPDFCPAGTYWECVCRVGIRHASDNVMSMMEETYGYTGGAHGMTWHAPINLLLSSSGASRFGLDDIFLKGSNWQRKVSELIIADLRQQEASWIIQGEITEVDPKLLDRFTVSPAGIDFYFGPYEMGCYAEGTYVSFLPWAALEGLIRTSGPVGLLRQ
jgi:hypothetical protein